jgi:spermidine/putrescine transport system ATP-binding protein
MPSGSVNVENVTKKFGGVVAVDNLSIDIQDGEFFTFLGPSGCGKTTTLRMIAGFNSPSKGNIQIGGNDVTDSPPYERNVGMVFQSYALFPHKTVGENVGFGLKMAGERKATRDERIAEMLELVSLPGFEDRSPTDLSGGQQQRVALARALIIEPNVLLLDEPLANLDLKLRQEMRYELQRIQEETGITTIYVTHDQEEALSMSDRVLVMNDGHREQVDTPRELYNSPSSEFVADFIGDTNLFYGQVDSVQNGHARINLDKITQGPLTVPSDMIESRIEADDITMNVRPEDITPVSDADESQLALQGEIKSKTFYGQVTTLIVNVEGKEVFVDLLGRTTQTRFNAGDTVKLSWDADDCLILGNANE